MNYGDNKDIFKPSYRSCGNNIHRTVSNTEYLRQRRNQIQLKKKNIQLEIKKYLKKYLRIPKIYVLLRLVLHHLL